MFIYMFQNKYLKYKNKYLNLKTKIQLGKGFLLDNSDIRKFTNIDLRDTLNIPSVEEILNGTMSQANINKHLLTAIITVNNYIDNQRRQIGGGYVLDNQDIRKFTNMDLRDTLNIPSVEEILNGTMTQSNVNKHLLTAIVTVNNKIDNQNGGGYVLDNQDIRKFTNKDLRDTLNIPSVEEILNDTMTQANVNKHLLTAIVTVNNKI